MRAQDHLITRPPQLRWYKTTRPIRFIRLIRITRLDAIDMTMRVHVICVILAALCHDLGHPCYSHMFETFLHHAQHLGIQRQFDHDRYMKGSTTAVGTSMLALASQTRKRTISAKTCLSCGRCCTAPNIRPWSTCATCAICAATRHDLDHS